MWKVNFCVLIGLALIPTLTVSVVLRDSYIKAYDNTRRISPSKVEDSFFLSGLYNIKGKPHDLGADFGLTSDVYTKPNPFYLKNKNKSKTEEKKPEPVYYPVYNHSVTPDGSTSASSADESYDVAPTSFDAKSHSYQAAASSYGPPSYSVQSVPSTSYGAPGSSYGSPSSSYGSPGSSSYYSHASYGPPQPTYGAPSYYPSATHTMMSPPEPETQKGSHTHWIIAKILKKFDLILMSKILLKIIIFKKIVKFIGLICLLMFIPVLKKKFDDHSGELDDDEERRIKSLDAYANVDFRLKEIVNFAFTAIEGFSANNIPWCVGESEFYCRVQYMLDQVDLRYQGGRIVNLWFPKLETTTTAAPPPDSSEEKFDEGNVDFNESITESPEMISTENDESEATNENRLENFNAIFRRRST